MILQSTVIRQQASFAKNSLCWRPFYSWLNYVFNRVDENRMKEVGPDRVTAEWILRCGGSVKFINKKWVNDYNRLESGPRDKFLLESIDATGTSITNEGLRHIKFLEHLKSLNLTACHNISDFGLQYVTSFQHCLTELSLNGCSGITDAGLLSLSQLKLLQSLDIRNLLNVEEENVNKLKTALSQCEVLSGNQPKGS